MTCVHAEKDQIKNEHSHFVFVAEPNEYYLIFGNCRFFLFAETLQDLTMFRNLIGYPKSHNHLMKFENIPAMSDVPKSHYSSV